MFIAEDFSQFKNLFVSKLRSMLSDDELGAFILVLANAQQNLFLRNELIGDLEDIFAKLTKNFSTVKQNSTPDDVAVFQQLLNLRLSEISVWQHRSIGDWDMALNTMRQLRPARASTQTFTSIKQDYDASKFHFNKPFLAPEILWQGEYQNTQLKVLYNKFPFSDYHLLIAVSPEDNTSQLISQKAHQLIFSLTQEYAVRFPGFGVGFNSLAAGASVNHLHFQGFIREQAFPIEKAHWSHHGGERDYPLTVNVFTNADSAWVYISQLIEQDIAFNCLYRENGCYVIPRKYQGAVELPDWLAGAGWLDVAGVMTVSDKESFNSIDAQSVTQALALLKN